MIRHPELWLIFPVLVLAATMTSALRHYGVRWLLDHPNERSSHDQPVPRGGGLAIAAVFLVAVAVLWWFDPSHSRLFMALLLSGSVVAAAGYWDDHVDVRARWRLLLHLGAAVLAAVLMGPMTTIPLPWTTIELPTWLGATLTVMGLVWLLNLYNFMDGIDGIAGGEAVSVALAAAAIGFSQGVATPGLVLFAAACAGFLLFNWPPARIFMGDVGSGFAGFVFGLYVVHTSLAAPHWLWVWVILLAVFWIDATVTLLRRLAHGETPYAAHRTHAFQNAARLLGSHRPVTVAVVAINTLFLAPLAFLAAHYPQWSFGFASIAVVPLAIAAIVLRAGQPEHLQSGGVKADPAAL